MSTRCLDCRTLIARGPRCRQCAIAYRGTWRQTMAWRQAVLEQNGYRCVMCGHYDPTGKTLEADHIVPLSHGGERFGRGQAMCKPCHKAKTNGQPRRGASESLAKHDPTERAPSDFPRVQNEVKR